MEKRVIVFLILSLAIIIGYDYVLKQVGVIQPPADPTQLTAPNSSATKPQESAEPTLDKNPSTETAPTVTTTPTSVSQVASAEPASEEQTEVVVTDLFRAVFTNRGAALTSWELTRYTTTIKDHPEPVQMVYHGGKF